MCVGAQLLAVEREIARCVVMLLLLLMLMSAGDECSNEHFAEVVRVPWMIVAHERRVFESELIETKITKTTKRLGLVRNAFVWKCCLQSVSSL